MYPESVTPVTGLSDDIDKSQREAGKHRITVIHMTPFQKQFATMENTSNIWCPLCDNYFLPVAETLTPVQRQFAIFENTLNIW